MILNASNLRERETLENIPLARTQKAGQKQLWHGYRYSITIFRLPLSRLSKPSMN